MENRPFKKQTIEMYIGCLKTTSKSPTQTQSKLIASPSISSKFSPSQFLSNSPTMKHKKLKEKMTGLSMFEKYTGKPAEKKDAVTLISASDSKKDASNVGPVRKNVAFLKNLEKENISKKKEYDENDPRFRLNEAIKFEGHGLNLINSSDGKNLIKDDEDNEIIQYEGYIYKITDSNKFKKLWFKLYDKDLFCKYI
jgi:hypothetical protein